MKKKEKSIILIVVGTLLMIISISFLLVKLDVIKTNQSDNDDVGEIGTLASSKIKITFDANGGSVSKKNVSIKKGSKVGTLPTPTRKNYKFVGWYTKKSGGSKVTSSTKFSKTTTIYARWQTIAVSKVKLDKSSVSVNVGQTVTLKAALTPTNATNQKITWSSSNTKIATVDKNGKVKGIKAGSVTITATSNNGKKATCKVTVSAITSSKYVITKDKKYNSYANKASYDSSTLKYRVFSYKNQNIILVWVADPIRQLESALAYPNAQGVLPSETILKNEINKYNLKNKGLIAVNASFFVNSTPKGGIVVSHGKIAKNTGNSDRVIGINNKGKLTEYNNKPASTFVSKGVHSTFTISSASLKSSETKVDERTQICQYDTNNFVLFSGTGTVSQSGKIIVELTGCKEPFNLDGGGSRKIYYKTKDMSEPKKLYGGDRKLPDMLYFYE